MIRQRYGEPGVTSPGAGGPGGDNLESTRDHAYRVAAAGDAAIDRVLSDSPEDFLRCNRQEGGE